MEFLSTKDGGRLAASGRVAHVQQLLTMAIDDLLNFPVSQNWYLFFFGIRLLERATFSFVACTSCTPQ